jgi:hypothetical protein
MLPQWLDAPAPALESMLPAAWREPVDPAVAVLCAHVDALSLRTALVGESDPPLDPGIVRALFAKGLFSLTVPAEQQGLDASLRDFVVAMEHVGRLGPAYAMTAVPHLCISVKSVASLCSPAVRQSVLHGILDGERLVAFAISEDCGSDVAAMKTRLIRAADGRLVLTGRKQWITNLARASHIVVVALCPALHPAPGAAVLVLVEADQPGVSVSKPWDKSCANGSDTADLFLDSVEIAEEQVLGAPGQGMALFHELVQPGRLGAAAATVGMVQAALRSAVSDPEGPLTEADAEELAITLDLLGAALRSCAVLGDARHPDFPALTALVKHGCSSLAQSVVNRIDHAYAVCGLPSPPVVQRVRQAIGLFRLLKGPGEVISQQALMAWSARIRREFAPPALWPRDIRLALRVVTRAYAQLGQQGGPAVHPAAALSLADLCTRAWLLISAAHLAHDGARRLTPARVKRCRRWAWRHFCALARQGHSLSASPATVLNELYVVLRDAARADSLSQSQGPEVAWQ